MNMGIDVQITTIRTTLKQRKFWHDSHICPFGQNRGADLVDHLPVKGIVSNPSMNQPTNGKRTSTLWQFKIAIENGHS